MMSLCGVFSIKLAIRVIRITWITAVAHYFMGYVIFLGLMCFLVVDNAVVLIGPFICCTNWSFYLLFSVPCEGCCIRTGGACLHPVVGSGLKYCSC
jgi:hypothetical protein